MSPGHKDTSLVREAPKGLEEAGKRREKYPMPLNTRNATPDDGG